MPATLQPHQIGNVLTAVGSRPWALDPRKSEEIEGFLELRAAGVDTEELREQQAKFEAEFRDPLQTAVRAGTEVFTDAETGKRITVDGVHMLELFGTLAPRMDLMTAFSGGASLERFTKRFRAALAAESVKTVLLLVDSPGGDARGVAAAAKLIRDARTDKRIVIVAENLMASGALWIGTAGTVVEATMGSEIGSHGVFLIHTEFSEAMKEAGQKSTKISAGENKALATRFEPLSDKARADLQREVNDMFSLFTRELALNRNVSEQFVLDRFGQGKVFQAEEAVDRKMIDGVISVEEVIDRERRLNANSTSVSVGGSKTMNVSGKVKAALYSCDIIDSIEASDEVCAAYLNAMCKAHGKKLADCDDAELIAMIPQEFPQVSGATHGIDDKGEEYTTTATADEHDKTVAELQEQLRTSNINAMGRQLNVSDTAILAAVTDGLSVEEAREKFKETTAEENFPVGIISMGSSQEEKFADALSGVFLERCGIASERTNDERSYMASLQGYSMLEIGRTALHQMGGRACGDPVLDARAFLAAGMQQGGEPIRLITNEDGGIEKMMASTSQVDNVSLNRRGDHPDALSNLMGRLLDVSYDQMETTFQVYSRRRPDLPDFRPHNFIEAGVFQELDLRAEDTKHEQLLLSTNLKAYIQADDYGDKVALTTKMIVDDDLSVFAQQIDTLGSAGLYTVDNMHRAALASNVPMIDGLPMFSTQFENLIDAGPGLGAPSATTASVMRRTHRRIKGFSSTRPMNRPPVSTLVPSNYEEAALQTFLFQREDAKVARTDADINTVRGTITPTIDAMLDDYSEQVWYTFSDTRYSPFVHAYRRGTGGARGTRTTWVDPDTGSRYIAMDISYGLAALNRRGAVRNNGA